eukprot:1193781-Prorocentrum_minimum.AAC.1
MNLRRLDLDSAGRQLGHDRAGMAGGGAGGGAAMVGVQLVSGLVGFTCAGHHRAGLRAAGGGAGGGAAMVGV